MTDNRGDRPNLQVSEAGTSSLASAPLLSVNHLKKVGRASVRAGRLRMRELMTAQMREAERERLRDVGLSVPALAAAHVVTTYEPMDTEPDVSLLNASLLERFQVLVPITLEDLDLSWRDLKTGQDLGKEAISTADVIFTPGLAVSGRGERLGQGGGCYDRTLPRRRPGTPVITIVHAHEVGFPVPLQDHDQGVDMALTTDGLVNFSG